jgi:hypothetical protein
MASILRRSALSKNLPGVAIAANQFYAPLSARTAGRFANAKRFEEICLDCSSGNRKL